MEILWGDGAQSDLRAALDFLRTQSPTAAERVRERIFSAVGLLTRFPELAPVSKHRGLRQLVVSQTPYLVIYRIHEHQIEIRAIIHARKDAEDSERDSHFNCPDPRTALSHSSDSRDRSRATSGLASNSSIWRASS